MLRQNGFLTDFVVAQYVWVYCNGVFNDFFSYDLLQMLNIQTFKSALLSQRSLQCTMSLQFTVVITIFFVAKCIYYTKN